jgi:hypothetical protein
LSEAELELGAFQLTGSIVIEETSHPLTIALPVVGLRLRGDVYLSVDDASPHRQPLDLRLVIPDDLLDAIDPATLRVGADGSVLITNTANPEMARQLATRLREQTRLSMVE